jgi:hypothetical protein
MDHNAEIKAAPASVEIISSTSSFSEKELITYLSSFSSLSKFEDNTWIIDKMSLDENRTNKQRSIYFGSFNNHGLLYESKEWAIKLLLQKKKIRSINENIAFIRKCANITNVQSFSNMSHIDIMNVYSEIFKNSNVSIKRQLETWLSFQALLKSLNFHDQYLMTQKHMTPSFPIQKKHNDKFIPENVVQQIDVVFKNRPDIPVAYRFIYWTLRLIPNRITEVLSMTRNCLKQINEETYILSIPTFKQAGPYANGTMKLIEIKYEGIGAYYIDLVKQHLDMVNNEFKQDSDFLAFTYRINLYKTKDIEHGIFKYGKNKSVKSISVDSVNHFIKKICEAHSIYDENGKPVNVTSHQFRHNAISDRMNSGIFKAIDIMGLTKHHNTEMIEETYTHTSVSDLKKDSPVMFRGRIINTKNERKLNHILQKPYAKRIYHLGICSDIRNCSKDKSQCLRCDFMIPDVEDLEYYKEEVKDWIKKKESAEKIGNVPFVELCQNWIDSYEIVINKVLNALSDENFEMEVT